MKTRELRAALLLAAMTALASPACSDDPYWDQSGSGDGSTRCDEAAAHLESCGLGSGSPSTSCTETEQCVSDCVLATDCYGLQTGSSTLAECASYC